MIMKWGEWCVRYDIVLGFYWANDMSAGGSSASGPGWPQIIETTESEIVG